jgi:hypothetical protein
MKSVRLDKYEITLLTVEEYRKYKSAVPNIEDWWWLRSPGNADDRAAYVCPKGAVLSRGDGIRSDDDAVRPALKSDEIILDVGEQFIALGNRWTVIGKGVAISNGIVATHRYDSDSNVWETSELKEWLEAWAKEGHTVGT